MNETFDKYSKSILRKLNRDNLSKIINFLKREKCDYIEDLIEDYLDIFTIEYDLFVNKYQKLNRKYNGKFLDLASNDMNYLEELYNN